jgi:thiamine-phosphate diphosphorylase/hydroxyethylthiazole kinase
MYQSKSEKKKLDGVAVVSAIIASTDPMHAAAELRGLFDSSRSFGSQSSGGRPLKEVTDLIRRIPILVKQLGISTPLCHNMTNLVVQNFAANVALAM